MDERQPYNLFEAAQFGDFKRIEELISTGQANANERDKENITAMHWAAINGHTHIVQYLIAHGGEVDPIGGTLNSTPLHWAARQGAMGVVVYLVSVARANPNIYDGQNFNALHLAAQYGHAMVCLFLIAQGMNVDCLDDKNRTPLMWSVYKGLSDDATQILIKFGANVNLLDATHYSALHWAVSQGNRQGCHTLITNGAALDVQDGEKNTPMGTAIKKGHKEWFEELIKKIQRKKTDMSLNKRILHLTPFVVQGAIFGILSYMRWYFGYPLVMLLVFLTTKFVDKMCMGNDLAETPFLSGVFQSSVFWVMSTHFTFLIWETQQYILINCFIFFLFAVVSFTLYHILFSDPGAIPLPQSMEIAKKNILEVAERNLLDRRTFCTTCLIRKPLRSKHDRIRDRCYAKFDHYCPWVNNVIAAKNHLEFVIFIGSATIGQFLYAYLAIQHMRESTDMNIPIDPYCYLPYGLCSYTQQHMWLCVTMAWCIFTGFWEASLFIGQVYMTSYGLTTNEQMNFQRYEYFHKDGKSKKAYSPFDKGLLQNWLDFFSGYDVNWIETYEMPTSREKNL